MSKLSSILEWGPISRVRRNHALEHATLQLLNRKHPGARLAGYSDMQGFWVIGTVSTDDLQFTVEEALQRLRSGEASLAIHPNCGTNFAVSGALAGTAAWAAMLGSGKTAREKLDRLPLVVMLVTVAMVVSQPLGPKFQAKVTTQANPGEMRVVEIIRYPRNEMITHRVVTQR